MDREEKAIIRAILCWFKEMFLEVAFRYALLLAIAAHNARRIYG